MLKSQMLTDVFASDETNQLVCDSLGIQVSGALHFMVFRTDIGDQSFHCALAGGTVEDDEVVLTPVGTGAYESLESIDGNEIELYVLPTEEAAIREEIPALLATHKNGDRLCFISEQLVERRPMLNEVFNLD